MDDPYHYVRTQETSEGTFLVVGGEDHKTGHDDPAPERFERLESFTHGLVPGAEVRFRWSGQIIEPADGLPYVGRNPGARHVHVGTGFSGTGMTFGTIAATMLADAVLGNPSPWADLYDARRIRPVASAKRFFAENVDFPAALARDRLDRGEVSRLDEVPRGEGRLVRIRGRMLAVARDAEGTLHARSAVCTHLGCHVKWNAAEGSWDCPCHGSRFTPAGDVLNGPAVERLREEPSPDGDR
jgi:Rieske Fe-S protein